MSRPGQKWHLRYCTSFRTSGSKTTQWFLKEMGKKEFINPIKMQQGPVKMKGKNLKLWWATFWSPQNTQIQNNSSHRRMKGIFLEMPTNNLPSPPAPPITTTELFGFHVWSKMKPAKNFTEEEPNCPFLLWPFKQTPPRYLSQLPGAYYTSSLLAAHPDHTSLPIRIANDG